MTEKALILNNSANCEVIPQKAGGSYHSNTEHRPVSFLSEKEIGAILDEAKKRRNGSRDELLLSLLFQAALRVSEALSSGSGTGRSETVCTSYSLSTVKETSQGSSPFLRTLHEDWELCQ